MANTIGHGEIYSVEMANTVGHAGIYSVEMTNTIGHAGIYSVGTTNTVGHAGIYSVETTNTVGHAEIYGVGKGIIDVGMVLHINKTDITVVTTVLHVVKRFFIVVAPYPMPTRAFRPYVGTDPVSVRINANSVYRPHDIFIPTCRIGRTDTGSVPTFGPFWPELAFINVCIYQSWTEDF
ncbi:hypothetical protein HMPREF9140_01963 [Prevotella micans F0438]|uniref:Uncharacterized protein n=1 Tax=Prevotella micans F0438 TaxID=883158 RepID=H1Q4X5_9BACT|nr:hypothetical protein HMPREF9140_01963 [Prevotella micans F0438]